MVNTEEVVEKRRELNQATEILTNSVARYKEEDSREKKVEEGS